MAMVSTMGAQVVGVLLTQGGGIQALGEGLQAAWRLGVLGGLARLGDAVDTAMLGDAVGGSR